jgi:putative tricarboxylic transport membrane protein
MLSIDRIIGIFVLVFCCIAGMAAMGFREYSKIIPLASLSMMAMGAFAMLIWPKMKKGSLEKVNWKNLYTNILLTVLYALALYLGGYFIASILYLSVTMYIHELQNKAVLLSTTIGITLIIYIVFGKLVDVPLPKGMIFGN